MDGLERMPCLGCRRLLYPFPKKPSLLASGPLHLVEVNTTTLHKGLHTNKAVIVPAEPTMSAGCGVLILTTTPNLSIIDAHIVIAAAQAALLGLLSPEQVAEVLRQVNKRKAAEAEGGFAE